MDIATIKSGGKKAKGPAEKEVKIKLTKEQQIYVNNLLTLENRIMYCREYMQMWLQFYKFFAGDFVNHQIQPNEEKAFFQAVTQLARKQFQFVELAGDTFDRGNDIMNVLSSSVSLAHIQGMNENTRSKLELDWHGIYLDMSKALGRMCRQVPGANTLTEALEFAQGLGGNGTQKNGAAAGAKKIRMGTNKSKKTAAILAFPPMGLLGLDCFYLGETVKGVLRLLTGGGLVVWSLVDFVRILKDKVADADGRPLN